MKRLNPGIVFVVLSVALAVALASCFHMLSKASKSFGQYSDLEFAKKIVAHGDWICSGQTEQVKLLYSKEDGKGPRFAAFLPTCEIYHDQNKMGAFIREVMDGGIVMVRFRLINQDRPGLEMWQYLEPEKVLYVQDAKRQMKVFP